ncbi:hypothetical protein H8N03_02040 [Ramlibacter sp. USB13]|uniref:Uncharacterized protein n=1 Tax=Ramlibacter cellulosilyticus TaxID=2764187 RepID=A0A923S9I0_9BURK|nr:hypothetical protein [Ramlibacter cellulosilyticus]MBC5781706.1 hypothetical protein [Ramlibacter cellulosilyticus]
MTEAPRRWIVGLSAAVAVAALYYVTASAHLRASCVERDTPYIPLCAETPVQGEEAAAAFKDRIARNPGDSTAWSGLLVSEGLPDPYAVLPGATLTSPHNHSVSRWKAAQALEGGRTEEAVAQIIEILRYRRSPDTARVLAQFAAQPNGLELLRPHLKTANEWLPQVLDASEKLKQEPGELLPVMAAAIREAPIPARYVRRYMRVLKNAGQWLDAYGLWVALHKELVPLLYNSGFDQPFQPEGFDWELNNAPRTKSGALIEQDTVARRGLVLDVEFTGKPFAPPLVRQFVFSPPGTYRLKGEFMGTRVRSEQGLAWFVRCLGNQATDLGRSESLLDTGGVWKSLEVEFTVPDACGPVVSLELRPAAAFEARTGIRGHYSFDAFSLARAMPSQ